MPRQLAATVGVIAFIGIAAVVYPFVAARMIERQNETPSEFKVINPADSGPGTLRAAIFSALRSGQRSDIVLAVSSIRLDTPLPPLAAARGLTIVGGADSHRIDASNLRAGAVLDLRSPGIVLENFEIANARDRAINLQARSVTVRRVTISASAIGINVADAPDLRIAESRFSDNRIGINLANATASGAIAGNRFDAHREAAIWALSASAADPGDPALVVSDNDFNDDRHAIVTGNVPLRITRNRIESPRAAGVLLLGRYPDVTANRIRAGAAMGLIALEASDGRITDNEIDHNRAVGILLRSASNLNVSGNHVYQNAYGIAAVLGARGGGTVVSSNVLLSNQIDGIVVIGDSSIVQRNRSLGNRGAGMRVLDLVYPDSRVVAAEPLLAENVLQDNGQDAPVRGQYRVTEP